MAKFIQHESLEELLLSTHDDLWWAKQLGQVDRKVSSPSTAGRKNLHDLAP